MAPSLEELKKEYAGRLQVEFIDTWQNPGAKKQYDYVFCPTQVFVDASGKELFRHLGYYSKKDILAKWKELGVDLEAPAAPREAPKTAPQPKAGG
jgi:thioredoxin 1